MKRITRMSLCPLDGFPTPQRLVRTQLSLPIGDYTEGVIKRVKKAVYYCVAVCDVCNGILLYSARRKDVEKSFARAELLWPAIERLPENVPKRIASFHRQALLAKLRNDSDAFALNIRKALEMICTDLEPSEAHQRKRFVPLASRIEKLANNKIIPDFVVEMMQYLRDACNFGGHARAEEEDVDPAFCAVIEDFFYIVVAIVYVAPIELKQFHDRVEVAKQQASHRSNA